MRLRDWGFSNLSSLTDHGMLPLKVRDPAAVTRARQVFLGDQLGQSPVDRGGRSAEQGAQGGGAGVTCAVGEHKSADAERDDFGVVAEGGITHDGERDDRDPPSISHDARGTWIGDGPAGARR